MSYLNISVGNYSISLSSDNWIWELWDDVIILQRYDSEKEYEFLIRNTEDQFQCVNEGYSELLDLENAIKNEPSSLTTKVLENNNAQNAI